MPLQSTVPVQRDFSFISGAGQQLGGMVAGLPEYIKMDQQIKQAKISQQQAKQIYSQVVNDYADKLMEKSPDKYSSKAKAILEANKFYRPQLANESPQDYVSFLLSQDDKAGKFFQTLEGQRQQRVAGEIAGRVTQPQPEVSQIGPMKEGGPNMALFGVDEKPAAKYQEEALRAGAQELRERNVPAETFLRDPGIAGLQAEPKQQKIDPLADLKRRKAELDNELTQATIDWKRKQGADAQQRDEKAIDRAQKREDEYNDQLIAANRLLPALKKASNKDFLSMKLEDREKTQNELISAGYTGAFDQNEIRTTKNDLEKYIADIKEKQKMASMVTKELLKTSSGPYAVATRNVEQQQQQEESQTLSNALQYARTRLAPLASLSPSQMPSNALETMVNSLPSEHQSIIKKAIEDARAEGYTDNEILMFIAGKQNTGTQTGLQGGQ